MSFAFAPPRRRRKPSLTPMIDVVFLLLVFFMLAARFGHDQALPLALGGAGEGWSGPPRLIDVLPEGVRLNGVAVDTTGLLSGVNRLTETPEDPLILRAAEGTTLQRVVDLMTLLRREGFARLVLVEE